MFNNIKIYKSATQKSIMDITSALDFHKEKPNGEQEYKGKLVFAITEMTSPKKYEKGYVSKSGAKMLFYSMINGTFSTMFQNGFAEYGGSKTPQGVRARVFSVKMSPKQQFIFQIDEGIGKLGANGSIQMAQKQTTVQTYVAFQEGLKLAHEVYDFIKEAEMISMLKGKPYFTITPERANDSYSSSPPSYNHEAAYIEPPAESYIIKLGNWAGKPISSLDSDMLETVVTRIVPDTPDKVEFVEEAHKELLRRQ